MRNLSILKSIFGATLLLTPFVGANARQLNPEEAIERAFSRNTPMQVYGDRQMKLSYTESIDSHNYAYVFNNSDKGFIVLSADDRMPAILGYSNQGVFDLNKVSPSLRWWLSQYAEQASAQFSMEDAGSTTDPSQTRAESERKEIPHLIQTEWGQEAPYNLDCPEVDGKLCVTGCVATAMAQIIKYHSYPTNGNGIHQYGDISFDFGNATFRYDLMEDTYSYSSDKEANDAVAQLMFACGVSVDMSYTTDQSGAKDSFISYALREYFKYDNGVRYLKRDFFTSEQWEDLIYSELSEQRPVLYGGQAPHGGHQFICDGYDGDGYFHINWGWDGYGDGFFKLNALDPNYQGVGGYEGGYNSDQAIVCGIQPPVANSEIWYPIYSDGDLNVTDITGDRVELNFTPGGIWNYSQENLSVQLLIEAVAEDGTQYISEPYPFMTQGDSEPRIEYPFAGTGENGMTGWTYPAPLYLPKDLPAGEYKCYVVIKTPEGNIQRILFPITSVAYFNLTISQDGNKTYSPGMPEAITEIKVIGFKPNSEVIQNEKSKFLLTIENLGDYSFSGNIELRIFKDGTQVNDTEYFITFRSIEPGGNPTYIYENTFDFEPGTYDFIFYDQYGKQISDPFQISIGASGVETIFSTSSSINIYSSDGKLIKENADITFTNSLPKGIYILKNGSMSCKIIK